MSITDLLEKVNKIQAKSSKEPIVLEVTRENEPERSTTIVPVDLSKLSSKELLELNKQTKSWLETHFCQTGMNNKLDINDRPYDETMFNQKLRQYEETIIEYFGRPLGEELEGVL